VTPLALSLTDEVASPFVNGVVTGSVYGLLALGIVLIYKSNRFFNFAIAEIGTVALLVAAAAREGRGLWPKLPFALACVVGVAAAVLVSVLTERLIIRPLFRAARVTLVVATTGVALFLVQGEALISGAVGVTFLPPDSGALFKSGNVLRFTVTDLLIIACLVGAGLLAVVFFRSRYGAAVLAVSQEPTAASAVGINISRVSMLTWGLAGLLAGLAGVAYAPRLTTVSPAILTFGTPVLTSAFVAAVLGGMTSLPGAFVGGIAIGLVQEYAGVAKSNIGALDKVPGFGSVVVLVLLLLVLLVRPKGLLGKET